MVYCFYDYTLDPACRELRHGGQRLALEPKVFQVLLYLLEHRDRVIAKEELFEQCWPGTFVSESALTRCLARLRKAVQPMPSAPPVIETLHRQGYRFVAEVTVLTQPSVPAPVDTARPPASPPLQAALPVPPVATASPARSAAPGAERRQLTVLCCELADAPAFTGRLDPEDLREVFGQYHATCTAVIQHYGGHVAQYLGEGLLVYFGWPQAHEDDARRAVHAGLALLTAVHDLDTTLGQDAGLRLVLRIGVHTGLVVVGAGEEGGPYGQLALGATPNLAARIQALAAPDSVVISDATAHLVQGYFVCASLGEHVLPGAITPSRLHQVRGVSGAHGRLDVTVPQHLTPFVGREVELAVLRERAAQVQQGQGQVVLLRGEAGIGKSRLVQAVTTELVADGFTTIELRGSPYAQHTALHPVVEWLQQLVQGDGNTSVPACLERLEQLLQQAQLDCQEHLPLLASLLRLDLSEAPYPAHLLTPQRQRQCTLDMLVALVLACAERQLVLLIVEDLHWIDPTTLEGVGMLIDQGPTAPLLTLMTCRPAFVSPWSARVHVTRLSVPRLAASQVTQIVQWHSGNQLSAAQLQHIVTQTDGVPLFAEEVTKYVLAAHRTQGDPGGPAFVPAAPEVPIPATLRDALMARLDQLGPAKGTAQLGATIGREFPYALLQAVTPLEEDLLRQELTQLVETELLYQRGVGVTAVYLFKHVLIQEAAYASLLRRTRQQFHQHIAQVLETQFPETVATQPELLAHHYTEAGRPEQAVPYCHRAGQRASERSAHVEAIAHLRTGLALLQTLPETPQRLQRDVDLHIALGASLLAAKGFAAPEVGQTYRRARQLCQALNNPHQLFPVVRGLWHYYYIRAEYPTARALGEQLLTLAQEVQETPMLVAAHRALGTTLLQQGAVVAAHTHFTQGMALYAPQQHRVSVFLYGDDEGVLCHSSAAWTLWYLGYPDQALAQSKEAVTLAQQVAHPFSVVYALGLAAIFHSLRYEVDAVQARAAAAIRLATEQGFPFWIAVSTILHGWAIAHQGRAQEGVEQLTRGLGAFRAMECEIMRPYYLALLADVYGIMGEPERGLAVLTEALTLMDTTNERGWEPGLYRLKGELLLQQSSDNQAETERCFHHALDSARNQQAKSFELRTAISLSRLWQSQGKHQDACDLLAPVYSWFTEGFDTVDVQEAKALLDALLLQTCTSRA